MAYRKRKTEQYILDFFKVMPDNLLWFPLDIRAAASILQNCSVHTYQAFAKYHGIDISSVVSYCESEDGCTHKEKGQNKNIILINNSSDIPKERKIFSLAHEIGHVVSGHMQILENYKIYHSTFKNSHFESEANYFAACVLAPTPILYEIKPEIKKSIHHNFGLSWEASGIALENYRNYDKNYNIPWHNEIIKIFDNQIELLKISTFEYNTESMPWKRYNKSDEFAGARVDIPRIKIKWEEEPRACAPFQTEEEKREEAERFSRLEEESWFNWL